ncbi:hypothetical protein ACFL18_02205 [Patescibacteria group bacterium]
MSPQELSITSTPKEKIASFGSALFISEFPGVAKTQSQIAKTLLDQGVDIHIVSSSEGLEEFQRAIPELISTNTPENPDWVFISHLTEFENQYIQRIQQSNPSVKIGLIEQTEGDAKQSLENSSTFGIQPNLILSISETSTVSLSKLFPEFPGMIFPLGNAEMDHLLDFDIQENRELVRKKLSIPDKDKIVTFIGRPPGAIYGQKELSDADMNSTILLELTASMFQIALDHPEVSFHILNLPHPSQDFDQPQLYDAIQKTLPNNLIFDTLGKHYLLDLELSSLQLCAASDLCTTIRSTLALQTSMLGTLPQSDNAPLTLHLLFERYASYIEPEANPLDISQLVQGAAISVTQPKDLSEAIQESLFNRILKSTIFENQKLLAKDFRFGSKNIAQRAAFTINLFHDHPELLAGFQNTAFPANLD